MAKYVVAVFSDLVKQSEAWKRIPREHMVALMAEYKQLAEKHATDFGRLHSNFTGDGHFFLFEDADAAVRFGLKLVAQWQAAFRELPALQGNDPLPLRVGVHFGDETELDEGDAWVGRCGNLAKRIEGKAVPDSVYVSEGLLDLIDLPLYAAQPVGTRRLRGDHLKKRTLYRIETFDEDKFSQKPPQELGANDWFLKGVAMIGTPEEDTDAEAECYRQALRLRPDSPEAHYNYGLLAQNRDDVETAEEHYKEVLRLRPDYSGAHNNYGSLLKDRGDFEGAEEHYKEALRLRPDDPAAHNNYGAVLKTRGDFEGAEEHYKEALRLRPDDPAVHYNYALLLTTLGHPRKAKGHFEEAFRLWPGDPDIRSAFETRAWRKSREAS